MSKVVQWKRGNVTVNDTYTGANGEITVDTTNWNLRVHDGSTAGGYTIASTNNDYSNANVVSLLADFGSNSITTTGNITAEVLTSNLANIANHIFFANGTIAGPNITFEPISGNVVSSSYFANNSFYVNTTNQLGYLFDTNTSGISGLIHYNEGNATIIGINHDGNQIAKFYDSNTTILVGNLRVQDNVNLGQTLPNAFFQITGNIDSYIQSSLQNKSAGSTASGDYVVTSENGTDETYYIDLGINSSQYAEEGWFSDTTAMNDGYLYVVGYNATGPSTGNVGNLILGSTNGLVKTFVGNILQSNVVTTVSEGLFTVTGRISATSNIAGQNFIATQSVAALGSLSGASLNVTGNTVIANTYVPSANNSAGTAGQITWDGDYVYVCVATDTWKRANLSTW